MSESGRHHLVGRVIYKEGDGRGRRLVEGMIRMDWESGGGVDCRPRRERP